MYQEAAGPQNQFTIRHLIDLPNMAVSEDTQLGTVLQMNDQSRVAAGNQDKLTFEECAQLLVNQAQVFDAAHT